MRGARLLDVVAGVLRQPHTGRVLVARRPLHKVRGGYWEFPGGKIEADEDPAAALRRELHEELAIDAQPGRRCCVLRHVYPDVGVRLQVLEVPSWQGELRALEHLALAWMTPAELDAGFGLSAADLRLARVLTLPHHYCITPDCTGLDDLPRWLEAIQQRLTQEPAALLLLRAPSLSERDWRQALQEVCSWKLSQARVLLSRQVDLALEFGLGVHLSAAQLMAAAQLTARPDWLAASCHGAAELARAAELGCDFVTLSPVLPTRSHPGAPVLGWDGLHALLDVAEVPVYALGGLQPDDLARAHSSGCAGVAGISAFWPD